MADERDNKNNGAVPFISAGILLGCGLGGFIDGIVLHQILQWHNMMSSVRPPFDLISMKYNMVWDGLFHAFTWLVTIAGLSRLWVAMKRSHFDEALAMSTEAFVGSLVLGWGLFNFIEGLVDHLLLGIHHVHPGSNEAIWDAGFLLFGLAQIVFGLHSIRHGQSPRRLLHHHHA